MLTLSLFTLQPLSFLSSAASKSLYFLAPLFTNKIRFHFSWKNILYLILLLDALAYNLLLYVNSDVNILENWHATTASISLLPILINPFNLSFTLISLK